MCPWPNLRLLLATARPCRTTRARRGFFLRYAPMPLSSFLRSPSRRPSEPFASLAPDVLASEPLLSSQWTAAFCSPTYAGPLSDLQGPCWLPVVSQPAFGLGRVVALRNPTGAPMHGLVAGNFFRRIVARTLAQHFAGTVHCAWLRGGARISPTQSHSGTPIGRARLEGIGVLASPPAGQGTLGALLRTLFPATRGVKLRLPRGSPGGRGCSQSLHSAVAASLLCRRRGARSARGPR